MFKCRGRFNNDSDCTYNGEENDLIKRIRSRIVEYPSEGLVDSVFFKHPYDEMLSEYQTLLAI